MLGMSDSQKPIDPQMQRLYLAAKELHGKVRQAEVARLLDTTSQQLNSWEKRGISANRQLDMARMLGCGLVWLRDGVGDMRDGVSTTHGNLQDVVDLITWYGRLTESDRHLALRFVRSLLREE